MEAMTDCSSDSDDQTSLVRRFFDQVPMYQIWNHHDKPGACFSSARCRRSAYDPLFNETFEALMSVGGLRYGSS